MKEPLTGNIDFLLTIDTTNGQRTFNATLKNIEGNLEFIFIPIQLLHGIMKSLSSLSEKTLKRKMPK